MTGQAFRPDLDKYIIPNHISQYIVNSGPATVNIHTSGSIDSPVFLCGSTRSGTTLLSLMLNQHSRMTFCGEFEWVFDFTEGKAEPQLEEYQEWLALNRHFRWHDLSIDNSLDYSNLIRDFLSQMCSANNSNADIVIASIHRHYEQIYELWPKARFVHIVRDGRDVCASWIKFGWFGNAWVAGNAWKDILSDWSKVSEKISSDNRFELKFENLAEDPKHQLQLLCHFLGAEYEPEMLEYWKSSTYDPVNPAECYKYRKSLSQKDINLIEKAAADFLFKYDYEVTGNSLGQIGPATQRLLKLDDKLRKARSRIKTFGFNLWLREMISRRLSLNSLHKIAQLEIDEIINKNLK